MRLFCIKDHADQKCLEDDLNILLKWSNTLLQMCHLEKFKRNKIGKPNLLILRVTVTRWVSSAGLDGRATVYVIVCTSTCSSHWCVSHHSLRTNGGKLPG